MKFLLVDLNEGELSGNAFRSYTRKARHVAPRGRNERSWIDPCLSNFPNTA